jgi:hypothetical protein
MFYIHYNWISWTYNKYNTIQYNTTQRYIPEYRNLYSCRCENLKFNNLEEDGMHETLQAKQTKMQINIVK